MNIHATDLSSWNKSKNPRGFLKFFTEEVVVQVFDLCPVPDENTQ